MNQEELEELCDEVIDDMMAYSEVDEEVLTEFKRRLLDKAVIHTDPFDDEEDEVE